MLKNVGSESSCKDRIHDCHARKNHTDLQSGFQVFTVDLRAKVRKPLVDYNAVMALSLETGVLPQPAGIRASKTTHYRQVNNYEFKVYTIQVITFKMLCELQTGNVCTLNVRSVNSVIFVVSLLAVHHSRYAW